MLCNMDVSCHEGEKVAECSTLGVGDMKLVEEMGASWMEPSLANEGTICDSTSISRQSVDDTI